MELEQRVDVLEDKVEDLRIEHAKTEALVNHTVSNLAALSDIVMAEQKIAKILITFIGKYALHIIGGAGIILSGAYYAGVHHIFG